MRPSTGSTPSPTTGAETNLSPPDGGETWKVTITRVVDGDTIEIEFSNGTNDTIRLLGVDTPETNPANEDPRDFAVPNTAEGHDWLLRWGEKAKNHTKTELEGRQVQIVTDPKADTRGSYGRLLAYVDGENFNYQLIKRGLARRYDDSEFSYRKQFGNVEQAAQANERRLWAFDEATPEPTATETVEDRDCSNFDTEEEAQRFFESHNPGDDPHQLDADGNGQACESLA